LTCRRISKFKTRKAFAFEEPPQSSLVKQNKKPQQKDIVMRQLLTIVLVAAANAMAQAAEQKFFSTEASITQLKDPAMYQVDARVSEVKVVRGLTQEHLIAAPRVTTQCGTPVTINEFWLDRVVEVNVSWPDLSQRLQALCTVTLKSRNRTKDLIFSQAKFKLNLNPVAGQRRAETSTEVISEPPRAELEKNASAPREGK
jgi:hypothetical protein